MVDGKVFTFCFSDYLFVYFQKVLDMKLEGYSNYEIDVEKGLVYNLKTHKFIGNVGTKGYLQTSLTDDNGKQHFWQIHRLIWTAVNGEIPEGMQVNHIDENKDNNSINNLNLMTAKENVNWGSCIQKRSKKCFKPIVALKNKEIHLYFPSATSAQRMNYRNSGISLCCTGKRTTYKGYQWQYQDDYLADWWEQEMEKAAI